MTASQFSLPHGKRVAVLISLLLESWAEGKSPSYFTRTTPLRGGAVDHAGVQWSTYGGKEGIWRLSAPSTSVTCGDRCSAMPARPSSIPTPSSRSSSPATWSRATVIRRTSTCWR